MKYNIGDEIFWVYSSSHYGKKVECPVCFGELFVTIILGNGEKTKCECGYCKTGYSGPSGVAQVWGPEALVRSGKITGITTRNGIMYEVGGTNIEEYEVFSNQKDAEVEREKRFKEESARSKKWFEDSFINCKESQLWSVGYHRTEIKRSKRNIEWHELRLGKIKDRKD